MVETLRKRFILISAAAVAIVLLVIATAMNLSNYTRLVAHADELVRIIVDNNGHFPKEGGQMGGPRQPPRLSPEAPFSTRFFTVRVDEDNTIAAVDTGKISVSTSEALAYAKQVLALGDRGGFIENYKFTMAPKEGGSLLVFVDCSQDLQTFYSFLCNSIWVCLAGLVAIVALVVLVSKRAIAPVAESYEKQKQFITNAGHELKTPLAIIQTSTEALELEQGESEWSHSIQRQVERLSGLVSGLVTLSRMDELQNQLQKAQLSFSEIVVEVAQPFGALAERAGHTLKLHIEEGVFCYGNEDALRQLISILLDNAIKYSAPQGEIYLTLERRGKKVLLQTRNPAPDLVPGSYELLFERFYRAETSRNRKTGGYGIGLSIAQGIVAQHRGKFTAHSPDGRQLMVTVLLP